MVCACINVKTVNEFNLFVHRKNVHRGIEGKSRQCDGHLCSFGGLKLPS